MIEQQHQVEMLTSSYLFDSNWYKSVYVDVEEGGVDPVWHFVNYGWKEKRNPSLYFNTRAYLEENSDVAEEDINPLVHYLLYGKSERRSIRLAI